MCKGVLREILESLAWHLQEVGEIDLEECFVDATFIGGKKGPEIGKTRCGKGTKLMSVTDGNGIPIAIHARSVSPAEVTLVHETLGGSFLTESPQRLIADSAYHNDKLVRELTEERIELIARHRAIRKNITQDGRNLRRYKRKWKIERVFVWLKSCRRIALRWHRLLSSFLRFVYLGCIRLLLRRYF